MIKFDAQKYYTYEETTAFLNSLKKDFPDYVAIEQIGLTLEKRKILLVSLTNRKTGSPENKPSLWVDGNTHASEITGAQSCLYFLYTILKNYKKDQELAYLLDHMTFYVLPQVSPDGAAFYLKNKYEIRSINTTWPKNKKEQNIEPKDMNGDDEVLLLRKEDPAGAFKISELNSDLLVQRKAFELALPKQKFFKLYREGEFLNYDGFHENQESVFGLDFNRQFPAHFRPEGQQMGAGTHPAASIEIRSFIESFIQKNRVFAHISLHTYGGLILRPPAVAPQEKFDLTDLLILKLIADEAARVSGYSSLSTSEDFKYYSRESETGTSDDWTFEHRGVFSFTVEIWDVWKAAQIEVKDHVSRYFNPAESDLIKIFNWGKKHLKLNEFYSRWKKLMHPQLGEVEVGGWKTAFLFRNPPPSMLEGEMKKVYDIILQTAKITPLIKVKQTEFVQIDENTTKVILQIENLGFLPTYGSQQALRVKAVQKPSVHLKMSSQLKLISGLKNSEVDHLMGRNRFVPMHSPISVFKSKNTNEIQLEWVFKGRGSVDFTFDFQKGGILKTQLKV